MELLDLWVDPLEFPLNELARSLLLLDWTR